MLNNPKLDIFLKEIMNLNINRMDGAATGIIGSIGSDSDTINSLKKSSVMFAHEYNKPSTDLKVLMNLSKTVTGYIQTLQLTNTLSIEESDKLINELQSLTDNRTTQSQ